MKWLIPVAVALLLNLGLIFWGRGSFPGVILPLPTSLWIGLPLLFPSVLFFGLAAYIGHLRIMRVTALSSPTPAILRQ